LDAFWLKQQKLEKNANTFLQNAQTIVEKPLDFDVEYAIISDCKKLREDFRKERRNLDCKVSELTAKQRLKNPKLFDQIDELVNRLQVLNPQIKKVLERRTLEELRVEIMAQINPNESNNKVALANSTVSKLKVMLFDINRIECFEKNVDKTLFFRNIAERLSRQLSINAKELGIFKEKMNPRLQTQEGPVIASNSPNHS
jgi:hypothetical protein